MRIFGITRAGFTTIAIAVIALWGCIVLEARALQQAANDARESRLTLERLRERWAPASAPRPAFLSPGVLAPGVKSS